MSAGTPDGGPAFPVTIDNKTGTSAVEDCFGTQTPKGVTSVYAGMTLRDYFAAKAMQGIVSCDAFHGSLYQQRPDAAAQFAYEAADAMLKARQA